MEAIGILKGNFVKRYGKQYIKCDTEIYLPQVKEEIVTILTYSPTLRISEIIFKAIKNVFQIDKIFHQPGSNSCIPDNDPLYDELSIFIEENEIYKKLFSNCQKNNKIIREGRKKFYSKNGEYLNYSKSVKTKRDKINRQRDLRIY